MYCRKCKYSLARFARQRCPECGTRFYANDPTTFISSLEPRRFAFKLVLGASAWTCCVLAFCITVFASLGDTHFRLGAVLAKALVASFFSVLLVSVPLSLVAYAVLESRRRYLARRWRAQSGPTTRCS